MYRCIIKLCSLPKEEGKATSSFFLVCFCNSPHLSILQKQEVPPCVCVVVKRTSSVLATRQEPLGQGLFLAFNNNNTVIEQLLVLSTACLPVRTSRVLGFCLLHLTWFCHTHRNELGPSFLLFKCSLLFLDALWSVL